MAALCLNSRPGPQGISTNIALPKGDLLCCNDYYDDDIGNTDDSNDNFDDVDDDANQRWFTSRCKCLLDSPIPDDDIAAHLIIRTLG